MLGLLARRLASSLVLLYLLLTFTFALVHLAPGDPVLSDLDPQTSPEHRERLRRVYGLDRPLPERYLAWLGSVVRGDWGLSFVHQEPVARVIGRALPPTLLLGAAAFAVNVAIGLPLGVAAARRRSGFGDHAIRVVSLVLFSIPVFWLGLMAILVFSLLFPVLPAGNLRSPGFDELSLAGRILDIGRHLVLPSLVLGGVYAGTTVRYVRNSLLETLSHDYVRTARAKGLSEARVVWTHALRNAAVPLVHLVGLSLPVLLNGSLIAEVIFAWPGVGRLAFQAVLTRDYPLVLGTTALSGALVLAGNLLADLLHMAVDPRVRRGA